MPTSSYRTGFWCWAIVAFSLMMLCLDKVWSNSVDLAHHYALVARLANSWHLSTAQDSSLREMSVYPRYSHILAAILGTFSGSPLAGIQLVVLLSLLAIWSALAFGLQSLPRPALIAVFCVLAPLLVANHWAHLELYGGEIVGNFFFAQFAAQAAVIVILVLIMFAERRGGSATARYLAWAGAILFVEGVHLLPALELAAAFAFMVQADCWLGTCERRLKTFVSGLIIGLLTIAAVIAHPGFKVMRDLSENNGRLDLHYTSSTKSMGFLCIVVGILSFLLLLRWARVAPDKIPRDALILKYLSLYGLAISTVCLLQILMLKLGQGSNYACFKYAFGLDTLLVLESALLAVLLLKPQWFQQSPDILNSANLFDTVFAGLFILVAFFSVLPLKAEASVSHIISIERFARFAHEFLMEQTAGRFDYAMNLKGLSNTQNYMLSIGALGAPRGANADDILYGRPLSDPTIVGHIMTSENVRYLDVPACRKYMSPDSIVILDGSCVLAQISLCQGKIEFADTLPGGMVTGFSGAESFGRWSDGFKASFTCILPDSQRPKTIILSTQGFAPPGHPQRILVSLNGAAPQEYQYGTGEETRTIEIALPETVAQQVHILFSFPDAISPKELGMGDDTRKIGIGVRSIEFR